MKSGCEPLIRRDGRKLLAEAGCVQIEVACNRLRADALRFYRQEGRRASCLKSSLDLTGAAGSENAIGW